MYLPMNASNKSNVLTDPLLLVDEGGSIRNSRSSVGSKKTKRLSMNTIYAGNKPKILLEQVTKRTATLVIVLTYLVFIACFTVDLIRTINSFQDGNRYLLPNFVDNFADCKATDSDWSCSFSRENQTTWIGSIYDIGNIISISLQVQATNLTDFSAKQIVLEYDVSLYACMEYSCAVDADTLNEFSDFDESTNWDLVLNMRSQTTIISTNIARTSSDILPFDIFGNTFQNQEALPTNSDIDAYIAIVSYKPNIVIPDIIGYEYVLVNRERNKESDAMLPILIFFTCVVFAAYCLTLYRYNPNFSQWLAEQKWILCYFLALILYQNPVYCVLVYVDHPSPSAVFASYIFDYFGQAAFLVIWLLFADGFSRKKHYCYFYTSKIIFGVLIVALQCIILTLQFPSLNPYEDRSPVEAVYNWPDDTKRTLIAFSVMFLLLFLVWSIWWFYTLWCSFRSLQLLPYMATRYLQLSFRYFFLQASLVATYYIFQYFVVIYFILANTPPTTSQSLESISDNINTLFRQQSQLFGRVFFLSTYAIVLAFLFLPASCNEHESVTALASTFVVDERELEDVISTRKIALLKLKNLKLVANLVKAKAEVFCVDRALELLEIAYEVYYDCPQIQTESSYGPMDINRYGYTLIDFCYEKEHETFCLIARKKVNNRIVVAFRGTASRRHWNSNLKYKKMLLDLNDLKLPELDSTDGLQEYFDEAHNDVSQTHKFPRANSELNPADVSNSTIMDYMQEGGQTVTSTIKTVASTVMDVTTTVVGTTTDIFVKYTPGLKGVVLPHVHTGFWEAYSVVRKFVHRTLRKELMQNPAHVCFTGHSLGGALATVAALDFKVHSAPRIDAYIRFQNLSNSNSAEKFEISSIPVTMYNFGSPRVGNAPFAQLFDKFVPDGFRVVVDGDIVSSVPYSNAGFKHIGTEALIDSVGAGSIIIDSSFIERRLRNKPKNSVSCHVLSAYRKSLLGVKDTALRMQEVAALDSTGTLIRDPITLAINSAPLLGSPQQRSSAESTVESSNFVSTSESLSPTSPDGDANTRNSTMTETIHNILSSAVQLKWNIEGERREAEKVEKTLHAPNAVQRREYLERSSVPATVSGGGMKDQQEHEK